ncbi:hypothetical protein VW35_04205 [Devosia soli]|uniref:DUF2924 domain-containing protein n=1 Tax=Devosia soli TaxID=361041 RepID=A0A0F5LBK7_9HYPH|nr:DUF2924 domain-containing protein [Devosia soli]KKB79723.1 hypothetical protein VW35_04205 [Devosia soli]
MTAVVKKTNHDQDQSVLAQIADLKSLSIADLKAKWQVLFGTPAPLYNRRFIESRLTYRIQELAYGGLKPETIKRLEELGEELDGGRIEVRKRSANLLPITGTRLLREWQGVEHTVTVTDSGFDYMGQPYQSLSAIARRITGTRWNGWTFFGLKNGRSR